VRTSTAFVMLCTLTIHSVATACDEWAAMVVSVNGYVVVKDSQALHSSGATVQPDALICPGQQLEVGADSRAAIYLSNNSFVRLDQNTVLSFPSTQQAGSFWVELQQGVTHFISRITQRFGVKTPYANAVVDGTEFLVTATDSASQVSVIEGQVTVAGTQVNQPENHQQATLSAGKKAILSGKADIDIIDIATTETVDWAVYFPPAMFMDRLQQGANSEALAAAAGHLDQNRPDLAIETLKNLINPGPRVNIALAASYLSVGNFSNARDTLRGVDSAEALALQSMMSTVTNDPAQALQQAQSAVRADPQALPALLALSYARQASLDLPAAHEVARDATQRHPQAVAAWIRLSETQVAMGNISAASDSVANARRLDPASAATLVQSGYVDLFNHRYSAAEARFRQAVAKSSEDPQARLGLGLVLLRQGELEAGRRQLEFAVSLDPARSVLRSYLGRAYFEEKRDGDAATQWELAKQLDPQDPTAYFYEGVRKLYANDPIGAIDELETSRHLNDERALYRSETLLQSDAASRSAALARAYDEVGYDQGVLLEGWNALREDPTNSEGHRLLADKYRGNSRYDAARASELLQSQLWQPLSAYPLQPQLAETGIGFVEGAGPQQPGYNEYHSLFTQDGVYGAVNGFGGSDGTWADDLVGSFLAGPIAVSLGQYHFESDGWRENADQEQDIYAGLIQWEISPNVKVQFEHRRLNWYSGYLAPELADRPESSRSRELNRDVDRLAITSKSENAFSWLISVQEVSNESEELDFYLDPDPYILKDDVRVYEFQGVTRIHKGRLTFGALFSSDDFVERFNERLFEDLGAGASFEVINEDSKVGSIETQSVYGYYHFDLMESVDIDFSLAYFDEVVEGDVRAFQSERFSSLFFSSYTEAENRFKVPDNRNYWLPKLGVTYHFDNSSNLRVVAFKSVSSYSSYVQTVEPVTFSGVSQLYDSDASGTVSTNYVLRYDQRGGIYKYGMSVMQRHMESPAERLDEYVDIETIENNINVYVSTRIKDSISVSVSGLWVESKFRDGDDFNLGYDRISRYQIPIKIGLFDRKAVSVFLEQVYYKQKLEVPSDSDQLEESTWITNVDARYKIEGFDSFVNFGVKNILNEEQEFLGWTDSFFAFYPARQWFVGFSVNL